MNCFMKSGGEGLLRDLEHFIPGNVFLEGLRSDSSEYGGDGDANGVLWKQPHLALLRKLHLPIIKTIR